MCYRGGRGVVPPDGSLDFGKQKYVTDESTSIRNCGDAYDGIRPGQMIVKFRGLDTRHGHADASVTFWCGRTTM